MNRKDRRARDSNKPWNYKTRPVAKNRQIEAELRSAAHGRKVLMECATCVKKDAAGAKCPCCDKTEVTLESNTIARWMQCHYSRCGLTHHVATNPEIEQFFSPLQWESKVLGMDASGAVLSEPFCPSCTRRGRRAWVTEQDGTGLTEAEIMAIGQERIITLCFLLTQMMNVDDYRETAQLYPLLTVEFIAKHTCQLQSDVVSHLMSLGRDGWIDAPSAGKGQDGSLQFKFAFGIMWKRFFERINAKKDQQIADAPKTALAIDCGHESPFQVMYVDLKAPDAGFTLKFLDADLLTEFREKIATGEIELHRPLLCPECDAKEKARNA